MANLIPDRIAGFNGYIGKTMLDGLVDVEMPSIAFLSETISGSGIAGEIDSPLLGQTESMECTMNFRVPTNQLAMVMNPMGSAITLRAGLQTYDRATGQRLQQGFRVSMRVIPKNLELGTLNINEATETSQVFEVLSVSVFIADKPVLEIDKLNSVFRVGLIDYLDPLRKLI